MKSDGANESQTLTLQSPLAEGRELKYAAAFSAACDPPSPLAEGRELKYAVLGANHLTDFVAPRGGA